VGIPTVVFTTTKFLHLTESAAKAFALPDARIAVVGHPIGDTPVDTLHSWADAALEGVVASYCGN
jgi:hypothetical protein